MHEMRCPGCGGRSLGAATRSRLFFKVMRLLSETQENIPDNMPSAIIAENVKGLRPYLPVVIAEYARQGYAAYVKMFNSKYWGVAQNRERYAVVGMREALDLRFTFPEEQHNHVPALSSQIDGCVNKKYYLEGEKEKAILEQAAERVELKNCHACITPGRIRKRQRGPRAKAGEMPMYTLTANDIHGIIVRERSGWKGGMGEGTPEIIIVCLVCLYSNKFGIGKSGIP